MLWVCLLDRYYNSDKRNRENITVFVVLVESAEIFYLLTVPIQVPAGRDSGVMENHGGRGKYANRGMWSKLFVARAESMPPL